jgi:hypothetical protein
VVLEASLVVDQGVQHVEPDFALRHLHFLVLEEIPELVAFAVHRIQAGRGLGALRRSSRSARRCSTPWRVDGPEGFVVLGEVARSQPLQGRSVDGRPRGGGRPSMGFTEE